MRKPLAAAVSLLLAAPVLASEAKRFSGEGIRSIEIETESGDVAFAASSSQEITVEVVNQEFGQCEVTAEKRGTAVVLKAKSIKRFWSRSECRAGFRVRAPKGVSLDAASGAGNLAVDGLAGALKAQLAAGDLTGKLSGPAEIQVAAGDVELLWTSDPKDSKVSVDAAAGDVSLTFPADAAPKADVTVIAGRSRNEFGHKDSARTPVRVAAVAGDVTRRRSEREPGGARKG
jgi:DUF4097 and DUF4098 domain-containing protein YvlB